MILLSLTETSSIVFTGWKSGGAVSVGEGGLAMVVVRLYEYWLKIGNEVAQLEVFWGGF